MREQSDLGVTNRQFERSLLEGANLQKISGSVVIIESREGAREEVSKRTYENEMKCIIMNSVALAHHGSSRHPAQIAPSRRLVLGISCRNLSIVQEQRDTS